MWHIGLGRPGEVGKGHEDSAPSDTSWGRGGKRRDPRFERLLGVASSAAISLSGSWGTDQGRPLQFRGYP